VTVTFLPRPGDHRFSFAVGRGVGSAVERNRLRRRLRALLGAAVGDPDLVLPEGDYLVRVTPSAGRLSYAELGAVLHRALRRTGSAA
jgi:ribonuclease P protein component